MHNALCTMRNKYTMTPYVIYLPLFLSLSNGFTIHEGEASIIGQFNGDVVVVVVVKYSIFNSIVVVVVVVDPLEQK